MQYSYFVGTSRGKKKNKPDEEWFSINILRENRYQSIEVKPLFVTSEERFNALCKKCPAIGTPVQVIMNLDNEPEEIKVLEDVPPLELY